MFKNNPKRKPVSTLFNFTLNDEWFNYLTQSTYGIDEDKVKSIEDGKKEFWEKNLQIFAEQIKFRDELLKLYKEVENYLKKQNRRDAQDDIMPLLLPCVLNYFAQFDFSGLTTEEQVKSLSLQVNKFAIFAKTAPPTLPSGAEEKIYTYDEEEQVYQNLISILSSLASNTSNFISDVLYYQKNSELAFKECITDEKFLDQLEDQELVNNIKRRNLIQSNSETVQVDFINKLYYRKLDALPLTYTMPDFIQIYSGVNDVELRKKYTEQIRNTALQHFNLAKIHLDKNNPNKTIFQQKLPVQTWVSSNVKNEAKDVKKIIIAFPGENDPKNCWDSLAKQMQPSPDYKIYAIDREAFYDNATQESFNNKELLQIKFRKIYETIQKQHPDAKITLVGKGVANTVFALQHQFLIDEGDTGKLKGITCVAPIVSPPEHGFFAAIKRLFNQLRLGIAMTELRDKSYTFFTEMDAKLKEASISKNFLKTYPSPSMPTTNEIYDSVTDQHNTAPRLIVDIDPRKLSDFIDPGHINYDAAQAAELTKLLKNAKEGVRFQKNIEYRTEHYKFRFSHSIQVGSNKTKKDQAQKLFYIMPGKDPNAQIGEGTFGTVKQVLARYKILKNKEEIIKSKKERLVKKDKKAENKIPETGIERTNICAPNARANSLFTWKGKTGYFMKSLGTDLLKILDEGYSFSCPAASKMLNDLLKQAKAAENKGYIMFDIKPNNVVLDKKKVSHKNTNEIVLDKNKVVGDEKIVTIIDHDASSILAKDLTKNAEEVEKIMKDVPLSPQFCPPEIADHKAKKDKIMVFQIGITLAFILCGRCIADNRKDAAKTRAKTMNHNLTESKKVYWPSLMHLQPVNINYLEQYQATYPEFKPLITIIKKMIAFKYEDRCTLTEALEQIEKLIHLIQPDTNQTQPLVGKIP